MGFREDYDRLIDKLVTEKKAGDILKAKEEFWKLTGKVHGDEPFFEMRISAFFDWYIFDRKADGMTPIEVLLLSGSNLSEEEKEIYRDFTGDIHSIFMVKKITPGGMTVTDLFTNNSYSLHTDDPPLGFYKNVIFEGRIFPYKGERHLSPALCFHPKDTEDIIKHVLKMARKAGETAILPIIHRLAHMNLKWETCRNIKARDIYKFEDYGKIKNWWNW